MTDDDDILAGEFALGLLDAQDSDAVLARVQSDAVLSLRIAWWRDQLAPLVAEAEVLPPERLWARIEAQLPVNDNSATLVRRWRALAVGATGVAAALMIFVGTRLPVPLAAPAPQAARSTPMVATLSGDHSPAVVMVGYDGSTGRMMIAPNALNAGSGDAELWIIPEDGKPRSMGIIDVKAPAGHSVPMERRTFVHPGATFAITLETRGGSPTGLPTGSIIASGKIISV
ncbi:anti-sigma factor [Sphingomonas sp.]|uniref:anti-sigma factor n=1 Tax=Sphingomonas sp. TaxID=28214 RepID=UPI0025D1552D|nr:anti-sigma factor [Sphingomonas sp.]